MIDCFGMGTQNLAKLFVGVPLAGSMSMNGWQLSMGYLWTLAKQFEEPKCEPT